MVGVKKKSVVLYEFSICECVCVCATNRTTVEHWKVYKKFFFSTVSCYKEIWEHWEYIKFFQNFGCKFFFFCDLSLSHVLPYAGKTLFSLFFWCHFLLEIFFACRKIWCKDKISVRDWEPLSCETLLNTRETKCFSIFLQIVHDMLFVCIPICTCLIYDARMQQQQQQQHKKIQHKIMSLNSRPIAILFIHLPEQEKNKYHLMSNTHTHSQPTDIQRLIECHKAVRWMSIKIKYLLLFYDLCESIL